MKKRFPVAGNPDEDIERLINAAIEEEDDEEAFAILDSAPNWLKKSPEFQLVRATILLSRGYDLEAARLLRDIERRNPQMVAASLPLAMLYMDNDQPAHALQAARRALKDLDLTSQNREDLNQMINEATEQIQELATKYGVPFETMESACKLKERAQQALDENSLSLAEYHSNEAAKIVPAWDVPVLFRAEALYFSGKTSQAISVLEEVLPQDPQNAYILNDLVLYLIGLDQLEQAQEYASRLARLADENPEQLSDIDAIIRGLALVEDNETLWKIAAKFVDARPEILLARSWHCLAISAIRSGNWHAALELMEKIDEDDLKAPQLDLIKELRTVVHREQPRLKWMPPVYPVIDTLFHPAVLAEWEALMATFSDPPTPSQLRKQATFFQKYPFMVAAFKRMLWDQQSFPYVLPILIELEMPEVDAEITRFALGQAGTRQARSNALTSLALKGRYTGPNVVKLWFENLGEWRDTRLSLKKIGPVEPNARPDTLMLIEKAHQAKNQQQAIALLRKAVELEPTSPIAMFNLGVTLVQSGAVEEGEAYIYHSVEVDPNYTFGHASIALTEIERGNLQEALKHLDVVAESGVIAEETAVIANLAWAHLAIQHGNLECARSNLSIVSYLNPNHPLLPRYQQLLKDTEEYEDYARERDDYLKYSYRRSHVKLLMMPLTPRMKLREALERHTRDMLVSTAHFFQASPTGKKGELADRLAALLLDEIFLRRHLAKKIGNEEREALLWLLEADGIRPWDEFVKKFGNDREESIDWDYQKPVTIPGRLRRSGLLYTGSLDNDFVAFIPADLRPLLRKLLKEQ